MPVRAFEWFLSEHQLFQTQILPPSNTSPPQRLGIDALHWLFAAFQKDSHAVALGGLPLDLSKILLRDITFFRQHGMVPLVVLPGCARAVQDKKPFIGEESRQKKREKGWGAYEKGRVTDALSIWASAGGNSVEWVNALIPLLNQWQVDWIRAPFGALAQLAYLQQHGRHFVQSIYSSNELLLYGVDRVIISFDVENNRFDYLDRLHLLQELQLSQEQFIETCLLAGCESLPTLPVWTETPFSFKMPFECMRQWQSGLAILNHFKSTNPELERYQEMFEAARLSVGAHPILSDRSQLTPWVLDSVSWTLTADMFLPVFGPRLPDLVWLYLSLGWISPLLVQPLIHGFIAEFPPNVAASDAFLALLQDIKYIRLETVHWLQTAMPWLNSVGEWWWCWDNVRPLEGHRSPAINWKGQSWNTKSLDWKQTLEAVKENATEENLQQNNIINLSSVFYQFLLWRGYISEKGKVSLLGESYLKACGSAYEASLFLALEWLRTPHLVSECQGNASHFIASLLCLLPVQENNARPVQYQRRLVSTLSGVKTLQRHLRLCLESMLFQCPVHLQSSIPLNWYLLLQQPISSFNGLLFEQTLGKEENVPLFVSFWKSIVQVVSSSKDSFSKEIVELVLSSDDWWNRR